MLTKILIQVQDTESKTFDYGRNISAEEFMALDNDNFRRNNGRMERFVDNMRRGVSNVSDRYGMSDVRDQRIVDDNFNDLEAEVLITDSRKNDIDEDYLRNQVGRGMFIIILNINPNSVDGDAASELLYWTEDSSRVIDDNTLDNRKKIEILPPRDYKVKVGDQWASLLGCKMVVNYSNEQFPYCYAVIVEKIEM